MPVDLGVLGAPGCQILVDPLVITPLTTTATGTTNLQYQLPNDIYALGPRAWSDFGEDVGDAGLRWGAAKAMVHRQRHATPSAKPTARPIDQPDAG